MNNLTWIGQERYWDALHNNLYFVDYYESNDGDYVIHNIRLIPPNGRWSMPKLLVPRHASIQSQRWDISHNKLSTAYH